MDAFKLASRLVPFDMFFPSRSVHPLIVFASSPSNSNVVSLTYHQLSASHCRDQSPDFQREINEPQLADPSGFNIASGTHYGRVHNLT